MKRKKDVVSRHAAYEPCGQCSSGWVLVGGKARRCWCWVSHQERIAGQSGKRGETE